MKIRSGFVTNSSSSSFVIAIRNDITPADQEEIYEKYVKKTHEFLLGEYDVDEEDFDKKDAMDTMFAVGALMTLGDWKVNTGWCSNEDDIEYALLYELSNIDTEKYKFAGHC